MSNETPPTEKHTPGPWSIGHIRPQRVHPSIGPMWEAPIHIGTGETRGNCHTIVYGGGSGATSSTEENVLANARLIAAAPDLLGALICLVSAARPYSGPSRPTLDEKLQLALRAIDKAEGR